MNFLKQVQIYVFLLLGSVCLLCMQYDFDDSAVKFFEFPKLTGQYSVGTKLIELVDKNRIDPIKNDASKYRKLVVQAWYPSSLLKSYDGTGPSSSSQYNAGPSQDKFDNPTSPYTYEMLKVLKNMLAEDGAPQEQIDQLDLIRTYAVENAQVLSTNAKYPVVVFAHGYATARGEYTSLCEDLASHGYVVFMVMHSYITSITKFKDGYETDFVYEDRAKALDICRDDIKFMLDQVQAGVFKDLTQICNFKKIGIVGHSLGGVLANHVCRTDSRVKAGISLDGPLFGSKATKVHNKPFMFMVAETFYEMFGDEEMLAFAGMTKKEFAKSLDTFCKKNKADSYKIILKNSEHCTFSDCPILVEILKEMFKTDDIQLGTGKIDALKAIEIIRAYTRNFFDKYLKGQKSKLLDGKTKQYDEFINFKRWV